MTTRNDIRKVRRFIRSKGWTVERVDFHDGTWRKDHYTASGGCTYHLKEVYVSKRIRLGSPRFLYLLLHECGHMLAARLKMSVGGSDPGRGKRYEHKCERLAYLLGTALAAELGIKLDRRAWREFNWNGVRQ